MSTRGAFVIPIHDLDVDGRDVEFPVASVWLRGALEGCEAQPAGPDGRMHVHLTKTGNEVLVQGQIDVRLVVPCARCLRPVELRPHVELSLLLFPGPPAPKVRNGAAQPARPGSRSSDTKQARDDDAFSDDEADVDTYEGDEVVLDRFVREAILLESPTFPLCSEACEGIRPATDQAFPSGERNPRLLPLLELAKRRNWKE